MRVPDEELLVPGVRPHDNHLICRVIECNMEVVVGDALKASEFVPEMAAPDDELIVD